MCINRICQNELPLLAGTHDILILYIFMKSTLTWINSDMPWMKAGTPGIVTVMEGEPPETLPPTPAAPPKREPNRWGKFSSGPSFCDWPVEAVLVVLEEVGVDVLADEEGTVEEEEEDEVEKENEWVEEPVDV